MNDSYLNLLRSASDGMMDSRQKKWLILSHCSNIDGRAAALHIDNRLPHLAAKGVTPLMLTGPCASPHEAVPHMRVPSIAPSGIRFELRFLLRRRFQGNPLVKALGNLLLLPVYPLYLLEKLIVDIDSQWSWFLLAAARGSKACREHEPEIVYSTGGASSAHIAAYLIAKRYRLPWIAELQDPLVHSDWRRGKRALSVYRRMESLICDHASAVVFLTDCARRRAGERTSLGDRGLVIYPGADPLAIPDDDYTRGERCRFSHFGSLGGSRNLAVFLDALALLFSEKPKLARMVAIDLYGSADAATREAIRRFPHPEVVREMGTVPRERALVEMVTSDVLLLIQNTEEFSSETIPSKTYEYLHVGRPILGLVHRNPELTAILAAEGHHPVAADSTAEVKRGISALLAKWEENLLGSGGRKSPYTVESAVELLLATADEARARLLCHVNWQLKAPLIESTPREGTLGDHSQQGNEQNRHD